MFAGPGMDDDRAVPATQQPSKKPRNNPVFPFVPSANTAQQRAPRAYGRGELKTAVPVASTTAAPAASTTAAPAASTTALRASNPNTSPPRAVSATATSPPRTSEAQVRLIPPPLKSQLRPDPEHIGHDPTRPVQRLLGQRPVPIINLVGFSGTPDYSNQKNFARILEDADHSFSGVRHMVAHLENVEVQLRHERRMANEAKQAAEDKMRELDARERELERKERDFDATHAARLDRLRQNLDAETQEMRNLKDAMKFSLKHERDTINASVQQIRSLKQDNVANTERILASLKRKKN